MVRLLVNLGLTLLANAIGLLVAAVVLDDMTVGASGFIIAVALFTLTSIIIRPLLTKLAVEHARALAGSSALLTAFVGLVVTAIVSDSLAIRGVVTWLLATVIVWAVSLLGGVLLPPLVLKRLVRDGAEGGGSAVQTWPR